MTGYWQITPDADDETAYAVLAHDRIWNGYGIADLEPPFRAYTRIAVAAPANKPPSAACVLLRHPAFASIVPYGNAGALRLMLAALDLPRTSYFLALDGHRSI